MLNAAAAWCVRLLDCEVTLIADGIKLSSRMCSIQSLIDVRPNGDASG